LQVQHRLEGLNLVRDDLGALVFGIELGVLVLEVVVLGFPLALGRFLRFAAIEGALGDRVDEIAEAGLERIEGGLIVEDDEGDAGYNKQQNQHRSLSGTQRSHASASTAGV
jgi:hypothetical protein